MREATFRTGIHVPMQKICSFLSCVVLLALAGCTKSDAPVSPEAGEWTLALRVWTYDEFGRSIVPAGAPVLLTVSAKDRALHDVMEGDRSTYSFEGLPYQQYLVTVQKEGYYPAQNSFSFSSYYHTINVVADLYPLPTSMMRIDSIRSMINTIVPQVYLRLFTPQVLPEAGRRSVVIFAGLTPDVSARYGTYVSTVTVSQRAGRSDIETDDIYGALRAGGLAPGMTVYVTARVMPGAATSWRDEQSGVMRYANLEENSRVVSSFIMP